MAATSQAEAVCTPISNVAVKTEPGSEGDLVLDSGDVNVKREPVLPLMSPPCGQQPLVWSQDHRLAVCTSCSLAVMELVCDVHSNKQDLVLLRTSLPVPNESPKLQVGPAAELAKSVEHFSTHPDPAVRQVFLADTVMNPSLGPHKGIKYAAWSPLGCDSSGRCLLACLTLDHRLTVHYSHRRLEWNVLVDLTEKYSARLAERGYAHKDDRPPEANLREFEELQRRYRMQTPLRMDWSSVYTLKQVRSDNTCADVDMVLLAVLMENGDLVLWKFTLPVASDSDVAFYDLIESGVTQPSDLAWWEHESGDRRMSGLIVGSDAGPVKIVPVSLTGVKGYFTLRLPVVLWRERDGIAVQNMRCVAVDHPTLKSRCSLVVASRGCYVFWCLLVISPAGLNVHNSHVTGLYSLPVVSLAVSQHSAVVYTCSADGWVKKLTPEFTEKTLIFQQEDLMGPDGVPGRGRIQGLSVSRNDTYMALASTQGTAGNHQVNFITLKTPEAAATQLLESPTQSLYKAADLLDLVRWQVLKNKCIPARLLDKLEEKIQESDSPYLWRFKLFLVRVLYQSFRMPPTEHTWKPFCESGRVINEDQEDGEDERDVDGGDPAEGRGPPSTQEANLEEQMAEVQAWIDSVESHIMRNNAKKVLGVVYLKTWITQNTSVPTCGLMDYLSEDTGDRDSEVLIGHIRKKMNKQAFTERCTLCQEVLPYSDHKQAVCKNGHKWLRCILSFQACQSLTFRRCLLLDAVAKLPESDDPEWIKKILQAPCTFCDSPLI